MTVTNTQSGTNVHEIAERIYRINTPVVLPGDAAFSFNQYLIDDDEPLLFHTGLRQLFPLVLEAVAQRDAGGAAAARRVLARRGRRMRLAQPVARRGAAGDAAVRHRRGDGVDQRPRRPSAARARRRRDGLARPPPRALVRRAAPAARLGVRVPDGGTAPAPCCAATCSPNPGTGQSALTESDILGPSEAFRHEMDYFSHGKHTGALLEKLALANPGTLACMHGSAWRGDGAGLLRALAGELAR